MPRGMHGRHPGTEKAKDFKGTIRKLIRYMSAFKVHMLFVAVFAVCGTIFNIVGPKILGKATTEIFNGLVSKVSGGSGIDFGRVGQILLLTLGLYLISALCTFIQGIIMTGVSQKTTYRLRKEISEKISRMPMNYFDTKPVGEVLSRVTNDVDTLGQSLNQSATQMITSVTTGGASDPAGVHPADLFCDEALPAVFPRAAGVSRQCKRAGGRDIQRPQHHQSFQ